MASWELSAERKRNAINSLIPEAWRLPTPLPSVLEQKDFTGKYIQKYLSDEEIEITETDAVGIVKNTTSGVWKAKAVAEAFCHRAALAHQLVSRVSRLSLCDLDTDSPKVNCLHEIFFEAAIADAQRLDDYFEKHGGPIGPLHGLPVSLKDQFHVRGVETTMGYTGVSSYITCFKTRSHYWPLNFISSSSESVYL